MEEDDAMNGQSNNSLLIELVKSVAVLTAKFDTFEKDRAEDNTELKESIKKVDDKVDKLDAKFESMKTANAAELTAMNNRIDELQKAPLKEKAAKWEGFVKLIFEGVIAACLVVILVKIGLK